MSLTIEFINRADSLGKPTAIVIGVNDNDPRNPEYTPWPTDKCPEAHGKQYAEWLSYELKPWVDKHYRTQPQAMSAIISGISLSGMMAYYILMSHPEVWGNALIQSPSMWVAYDRLMAMSLTEEQLKDKKLFISVGTEEGDMVKLADDLHRKFEKLGLDSDHLNLQYIKGEGHWHLTWRKSFAIAYPWLMN